MNTLILIAIFLLVATISYFINNEIKKSREELSKTIEDFYLEVEDNWEDQEADVHPEPSTPKETTSSESKKSKGLI